MGTSAVFAIASRKKGFYYTTCLGMTQDGFPDNLEAIAWDFFDTARKLQILTEVRRNNFNAIKKVLEYMERDSGGWLFVSKTTEAEWISHSAILDPKTQEFELFDGMFEDLAKKVVIPKRSRKKQNKCDQSLQAATESV